MAYQYCHPLDLQLHTSDQFIEMASDDNQNGTTGEAGDLIPNDPQARNERDSAVQWAINKASLKIEQALGSLYVVGTYGTNPAVDGTGDIHPWIRDACALIAISYLETRRLCVSGPGVTDMIADVVETLDRIRQGIETLQPFWIPDDNAGEFVGVAPQTNTGRPLNGPAVTNYGVSANQRSKAGVRTDLSTGDQSDNKKRPIAYPTWPERM